MNEEDDNNLNIENFFEYDFNSYEDTLCESADEFIKQSFSTKIFDEEKKINFGFFEKSNLNFYNLIEIEKSKLKIKHSKFFEISFYIKNNKNENINKENNNENNKITLAYNLIDNYPFLIRIKNSNDILISFSNSPKIYLNKNNEIISPFLEENINNLNNLFNFDCPYRNIFINDVKDIEIFNIQSKIFFLNKCLIELEKINFLDKNIFIQKIEILDKKINEDCNEDFDKKYITYANICQNLQKKKFESVISIYENFRNDFMIKKYVYYPKQNNYENKLPNNNNNNTSTFFILKHVSITPTKIVIKKEMLHQSSRFLRLYFNNDNFIKCEFKDNYDCQLYTNHNNFNKFNEISKISKIYEIIFKNGLILANKKYNFFLNPTNCMRANTLWLLEENEFNLKSNSYYNELGKKNLGYGKMSFSKFLSRLSQNFTSTNNFSGEFEYNIINDITNNENIYNDGCGMISYELMKDVCNSLNKGEFASAIQIRFKGAKGVLFVNKKIQGKKIMLTNSMVKFNCENSNDLEVIRFSKYSSGYLNLQIIILLILNGISKKKIFKFAKKEICNYRNYNLVKNEKIPFSDSKLDKILTSIEKENCLLSIHKKYMSKIARSTYIYNRLSNISKKYRFHLKNCGFFIGVCDFDNILNENEIFIQIKKENGKKKIITGDILITKNPCLSVYDLQKVKGIHSEYFESFCENVIVFPSKGKVPLPSKITGSDLDGDIYWVCWEKSFLHIKHRDYTNRFKIIKNNAKIENDKYHINENGRRTRNSYIKVTTNDFNKNIITNKFDHENFIENCLKLHIYFHSNYKLPNVNRNYLSYVSNLMKKNNCYELTFKDSEELEKFAFYHSIEVDFQKTGETSNFDGRLIQPTFLQKREQRKKNNILIKIKELYDEFRYGNFLSNYNNNKIEEENENNKNENFKEINILNYNKNNDENYLKSSSNSIFSTNMTIDEKENSFYDFFVNYNEKIDMELNQKYMKMYNKKFLDKDFYERSFIFKLYELVSYFKPMQSSLLNSLYLISEEYFYDNNINLKKFYFNEKNENILIEIFNELKKIILYYENEIKFLMHENEIFIEIELIYLTDFLEPKIPVFKNDIEDYKINLNENIKFIINNSLNKINIIEKKYNLNKEEIKNFLFILIFWIENEKIIINEKYMNIDEIIKRNYRIINQKQFINDLVKANSIEKMKYYFFDCIKCFTLYNIYCK